MRAPKSPFECYVSERIFSFAYLMCPSIYGTKAPKKKVSAICHIQFQWKVITEHFPNRIKKIWSVRRKIALIEKNISKEKICGHIFVVYVLIYPLSKFGGNWTNSLSFSFLQCPLQVKKLIRERKFCFLLWFRLRVAPLSLSSSCVTHCKTSRKKLHATVRKREYSWSNRDSVCWEAKAICGTTSLRVTVLVLFYESVKSGMKTKEIENNNNNNNKLDKRNKTSNHKPVKNWCNLCP